MNTINGNRIEGRLFYRDESGGSLAFFWQDGTSIEGVESWEIRNGFVRVPDPTGTFMSAEPTGEQTLCLTVAGRRLVHLSDTVDRNLQPLPVPDAP